jgi:hypothetical protein
MIAASVLDLAIANLCRVHAGPLHTESFRNSGDGSATQFFYVTHGTATFGPSGSAQTHTLTAGSIVDIETLMGTPLTGSTESSAASWVSINPIPATRRFDYTLIRNDTPITVVGGAAESIVVALVGGLVANDQPIPEHKFARIPVGKVVNIHASAGAVGVLLVTRSPYSA